MVSSRIRIVRFSTPWMNAIGRVDFRWSGPGDSIHFDLTVESDGESEGEPRGILRLSARPLAEDREIHMQLAGRRGASFDLFAEVPIDRVRNYRAQARVASGGAVAESDTIPFRPRRPELEGLNIEIVSVPNANSGKLVDLMGPGSPLEGGRYTLDWLKGQGKNCVWLLPPFPRSTLVRPSAADDGSPYAIQDFFDVDPRLGGREALHAFIDCANALGISVLIDLPLNHLGFGHRFRDLFVEGVEGVDGVAGGAREVRANDFSNFALGEERRRSLEANLADPTVPKVMEVLAPWMYGSKCGDPRGARGLEDIAVGGWFEWKDTLQLNHGRRRIRYHAWEDAPPTEESRAVREWLVRVLRFWAVDMRAHGFRIDHLAGTPLELLEEGMNLVQADVDRADPGRALIVIGEDFDTPERTHHFVDYLQGGTFRELLRARAPFDLERILESPHHRSVLALSSHDEARSFTAFGGDVEAAVARSSLLQLLGGPVLEVMGDHFAAEEPLPFKLERAVEALKAPGERGEKMALALGRVGRMKRELAALRRERRAWLRPKDGGVEPDLLVLSRCPEAGETLAVVVAANLDRARERENVFALDPTIVAWLEAGAEYRAFDRASAEPERPLWPSVQTGGELVERGLFIRLAPLQIQVIAVQAISVSVRFP